MADPLFDQISSTTLADLARDAVMDNFFVDTSWQRIMRYYANESPFLGGTFMQEVVQYDRVNGGAYAPGSDVQVVEKQILGAIGFPPKAYKEDVPLNLFQLGVVNNGPAAAVSIYDAYYENAVAALSTDLNIDFYYHGQASGTNISQNRSININGVDEALNDGINPGWLGNIYSTYGGQTRNGVMTNTLNSVPLWAGDQAGNTGQANWGTVLAAYLNCVQPPDTMLSNKALFQYLWQREEPKQRFTTSAKDERIGLTGMQLMDMYYHVDKLAPSTKFGALLPTLSTTTITPSAFTTPSFSAGQNTVSNYPSSTSCKPGEPCFLLRLQDFKIRPSADPEYNMNFTPLIRTQSNADLVVAWLKQAINMYTDGPRDNTQIVGFGY